MTVHTFVKGANTAAHLRPPTKRKMVERSPGADAQAGTQTSLLFPTAPASPAQNADPGQTIRKANRFPVSAEAREFYKRNYPGTTADDWNDWRWQDRKSVV